MNANDATLQLLAVEDDPAILQLIATVAELIGLEFQGERTIAQARRAIRSQIPDVLLVDGLLPDGTGVDFLAELRRAGTELRRVVFLSAYFKHFTAFEQLRRLAVDVVLHKPITPEALTAELQKLVGETLPRTDSGKVGEDTDRTTAPATPPGYAQLCAEFSAGLPQKADLLARLCTGWAKPEAPQPLIEVLHRLAGSAGSYGRPEVSDLAGEVETAARSATSPAELGASLAALLTSMRAVEAKKTQASKESAAGSRTGPLRLAIVATQPSAQQALAAAFLADGFEVEVLEPPTDSLPAADALLLDVEELDFVLKRLPEKNPCPILVLCDDDSLALRVAGANRDGLILVSRRKGVQELVATLRGRLLPLSGASILVVDDDPAIRDLVRVALPRDFEIRWAAEPESFWQHVRHKTPDAVVMDLNLPVYSGLELCRVMRAESDLAEVPVMLLTASLNQRVADQCGQLAIPYLAKPVSPEILRGYIVDLLRRRPPPAVGPDRAQRNPAMRLEGMVGESPPMREVARRVGLAAQSDVTVLFSGESGTGKEVAARALHARSRRRQGPFVAINCGAIPEALLESELFGHKKGAFTGAAADRAGLFEAASGGTVFLDEIEAISPAFQVKLLRVLQERTVRPVGANRNVPIDARMVAATNEDLDVLVAAGRIRQDFYYRIRVFEVVLPPLRERPSDIPLLVDHLIGELNREHGRSVTDVSAAALARFGAFAWPGNIRQLRNIIEHAFVTLAGDTIQVEDLPPELIARPEQPVDEAAPVLAAPIGTAEIAPSPPAPSRNDERQEIVAALKATAGNRTRAAKRLGYSRVTLWKKIQKLAIDVEAIIEEQTR